MRAAVGRASPMSPEVVALKKLIAEVRGILGIAGSELRAAVGKTNVAVLQLRVEEAEAIIAKHEGA
jgi:hypothetical protein